MRELIDLYGSRGFGAIAITDHLCESEWILGKASRFLGCSLTEKNFSSYIRLLKIEAERAWEKYKMLVIPGYEITKNSFSNHRSAHMLAIGVEEYIDPNLDFPEICQAVRKLGGISVAAHPVSTQRFEKQTYSLWHRKEELAPHFDAWEVASGPHIFEEVLHSGLPMIASSDLHHPKQMNAWRTVMRCEKERSAILNSIRAQEISFTFYQESQGLLASLKSFCAIPKAGFFPASRQL